MNPYVHKVHCSVCGGPGVATGSGLAAEWTGGGVAHQNPATCQYYLEKKAKAAAKALEDKAAQDRAKFDADDEFMFELWDEVNGNNS